MAKTFGDSRWRAYSAPIIAKVLAEHKDSDAASLKKALHDAYPFGPRKHHPYKIWCDEIKRQQAGGALPVFVDPKDQRKPVFGDKNDPYKEKKS